MVGRMGGSVLTVNVAHTVQVDWSQDQRRTAIDKRPVAGPVQIFTDRVGTDEHGFPGHGSAYAAVYAYGREDAEFWEAELGRALPPGIFGENLTTTGLPVSGAVSGERWRVGGALLQVTTPRIPCRTFAGWWQVPDLIRRFTAAGRPGAYLRVLEPGPVCAGDAVEVVDRPEHGVTVAELLAARTGDRSLVPRLGAVSLPPAWQDWLASVA
jgi:MOSC domain-containing protein YiiM